ncbi:hypothetical protein TNCV_4433031 [Trichonephila clavipes]|nr:hypothetical protein TNCV_4433031 [Trichonephila clavipes]
MVDNKTLSLKLHQPRRPLSTITSQNKNSGAHTSHHLAMRPLRLLKSVMLYPPLGKDQQRYKVSPAMEWLAPLSVHAVPHMPLTANFSTAI